MRPAAYLGHFRRSIEASNISHFLPSQAVLRGKLRQVLEEENGGTRNDFMIGKRIGGVNVFGGGLALYTPGGRRIGGIGLSGDTACTDHIIAWKLRHALNLDNVPAGVAPGGTDNIIYTVGTVDGFEHPKCFDTPGQGDHVAIANNLPTSHAVGPGE